MIGSRLHKEGKITENIARYPNEPYEKGVGTVGGTFWGLGICHRQTERKQMRSYEECKRIRAQFTGN